MSTAQSSIDQVCELYQQAGNKLREFSEMNQKIQILLSQIDFNQVVSGNGATTAVTATKKVAKAVASKPQKSEKQSKAKKTVSAPRSQTPLREVVFNVIKSSKDGLKVADVIKQIKTDGIWKTSGDLANMVNSTVHNLRKAGILVRNDETKTYKTASGATI